jgi:ferritin-like metal-binding protein YciE
MSLKSMDDLFLHLVKDIYYAEKQILKALPKMAKNTENDELKQAFQTHAEETKVQVERLEQVFEMLDKAPRGEKCPAILGLIEEGQEVMEEGEEPSVVDAGLLSGAQAVEHYEIARYGTLVAWARQLGLNDAVPLLEQTLEEEKKTDKLLSQIALRTVNQQAA